jgi:S-adenosylmethionine:tRNA ribosyltransferase-isomerase
MAEVRVSDFHFDLPEELIAQTPPAVRGSSRMLALDRATGAYSDQMFAELPQYLQDGDLLILNDSRVIPARLFATRARTAHTQANSPDPTGRIEVLLTQQLTDEYPAENVWSALVRPATASTSPTPRQTVSSSKPRSSPRATSANAPCASRPSRTSKPSSTK